MRLVLTLESEESTLNLLSDSHSGVERLIGHFNLDKALATISQEEESTHSTENGPTPLAMLPQFPE